MQAVTKEQWTQIESELSRFMGVVELRCDGYTVRASVDNIAAFRQKDRRERDNVGTVLAQPQGILPAPPQDLRRNRGRTDRLQGGGVNMPEMNLTLPIKAEYFDQIKDGTKPEEYRLQTPYWQKRLEGRTYGRLILTLGYPKRTDTARRLELPWRGYTVRTITHPHFGLHPVRVYAIDVGHQP